MVEPVESIIPSPLVNTQNVCSFPSIKMCSRHVHRGHDRRHNRRSHHDRPLRVGPLQRNGNGKLSRFPEGQETSASKTGEFFLGCVKPFSTQSDGCMNTTATYYLQGNASDDVDLMEHSGDDINATEAVVMEDVTAAPEVSLNSTTNQAEEEKKNGGSEDRYHSGMTVGSKVGRNKIRWPASQATRALKFSASFINSLTISMKQSNHSPKNAVQWVPDVFPVEG